MALNNKLPPLNLNSPKSVDSSDSNEGSNTSFKQSARERRRMRIAKQLSSQVNDENGVDSKMGHYNNGYEMENDEENQNQPKQDDLINDNQVNKPPKARRTRKNISESQDNLEAEKDKPPTGQKTRKRVKKQQDFRYTPAILEGLEEDIVDMDEEETETKEDSNRSDKDQSLPDLSQKENLIKSVPTDKFYLELEKKFAIQNKQLYEKKEQERLAQLFEVQLKQKEKEELKYQINTPKVALNTHKFLRAVFLFIHGINIGFQLWQVVTLYTIELTDFKIKYDVGNDTNVKEFQLASLFQNLTMPIHCLSYFFLTLCIIDTMDRVDLTQMKTVSYIVKCLSFQNQYWSIIAYLVSLIATLSIIKSDELVYLTLYIQNENVFNQTDSTFLRNINVNTWQSISIARAVFSLIAWLIFSVFVKDDQTFVQLEKREFSLFDDITNQLGEDINKQKPIALQQQSLKQESLNV